MTKILTDSWDTTGAPCPLLINKATMPLCLSCPFYVHHMPHSHVWRLIHCCWSVCRGENNCKSTNWDWSASIMRIAWGWYRYLYCMVCHGTWLRVSPFFSMSLHIKFSPTHFSQGFIKLKVVGIETMILINHTLYYDERYCVECVWSLCYLIVLVLICIELHRDNRKDYLFVMTWSVPFLKCRALWQIIKTHRSRGVCDINSFQCFLAGVSQLK